MAGSSLSQNLSQLKSRKNGSDLSEEADDHQNSIGHQKASVFKSGNGDSDEADNKNVEAEDDDVGRCDKEHFRPEVEFFNLQ